MKKEEELNKLETLVNEFHSGVKCDIISCMTPATSEPLEIEINFKPESRIKVAVCHPHLRYFCKAGNFSLFMAIAEGQFKSIPKDYFNGHSA